MACTSSSTAMSPKNTSFRSSWNGGMGSVQCRNVVTNLGKLVEVRSGDEFESRTISQVRINTRNTTSSSSTSCFFSSIFLSLTPSSLSSLFLHLTLSFPLAPLSLPLYLSSVLPWFNTPYLPPSCRVSSTLLRPLLYAREMVGTI